MTKLLLAVGVDLPDLLARESVPESRYWFGSPCRFVRSIDLLVHVALPELIAGRMPYLSAYLRTTSPRWGRSWRKEWN